MKFFVTAARGTEGALRDELRTLRLPRVRADRGGVHFEGDMHDAMRACLWTRIGMRVLRELGSFEARDADGLYDGVRALGWSEHLTSRHTLAVRATCANSALTHSHFIALKTKDAVVDSLRDRLGVRPDVNPDDPDVAITVRLARDVATVYLDLSGEPLHRRGYRTEVTEATLKETLAAAILWISGWTPEQALLDPLCGAGTIPLEAALAARRIAPGSRRHFGFERWPAFDTELRVRWSELVADARAHELAKAPAPIVAVDRDLDAIEATQRNARHAGLESTVEIRSMDVRDLPESQGPGWVVSDPPYGDRLAARPLQLAGFFRQFGEALRRQHHHDVALLTGNALMGRSLGMEPTREHTLFNGPIECRMFWYRVE